MRASEPDASDGPARSKAPPSAHSVPHSDRSFAADFFRLVNHPVWFTVKASRFYIPHETGGSPVPVS